MNLKWIKLTLATLATLTAFSAQAASKSEYYTIANPQDFAVISDKSQSSVLIFLSYVGESFDHCGIKIRTNLLGDGKSLKELLIIENANTNGQSQDLGALENDALVVRENPASTLFGALYEIKTRSGKSLKSVFAAQSNVQNTDAIVEILKCK